MMKNYFNPLLGNAPYFIILLCLTPDDFTHQGESSATQWVNLPMHPVNPLSGNAPRCTTFYYFTLSNARRFYLSGGVLPRIGLRAYQVYFRD
jgi:hypothetical protein